MPTLPLYDVRSAPHDAWHRVVAPGGYEWWSFEAESDDDDGVRVVAMLFHGLPFHPAYLRRYALYRRFPTRLRPPVPADFPAAYLAVYEGGRLTAQFLSQAPRDEFRASVDALDVQVGPNHVVRDAGDGAMRLHLRGTPWRMTRVGPRLIREQALSADLTFAPVFDHAPREWALSSRETTGGAEHRWIVADALCRVEGQVHLHAPGHVAVPRVLRFAGRGCHDHHYGTGPLGPGLRQWMWGRLLTAERAVMFQLARPRDAARGDALHVVEADETGVRELASGPSSSRERRDPGARGRGPAYPDALDLGPRLSLRDPQVLDASPFHMRLTYDARLDGIAVPALCTVVEPHRLRWPVLGRVIEAAIDRRTCGR